MLDQFCDGDMVVAQALGPPVHCGSAGGCERDPLHRHDRLPRGDVVEADPAFLDRSALLLRLVRQRAIVYDPARPCHGNPRARDLRSATDGGYVEPKLGGALDRIGQSTIEIVKPPDTAKGFDVLSRRWGVERPVAWFGRCRRRAKDREKSLASTQTWIDVSPIRFTTRRLARSCYASQSFEAGTQTQKNS